MIIHPQIQGCVARNCHPIGCRAAVLQQIARIRAAGPFNGPKRVLVLGASSGFGLASRIALAFGAGADTIGVSFERGPPTRGWAALAGTTTSGFARRRNRLAAWPST